MYSLKHFLLNGLRVEGWSLRYLGKGWDGNRKGEDGPGRAFGKVLLIVLIYTIL